MRGATSEVELKIRLFARMKGREKRGKREVWFGGWQCWWSRRFDSEAVTVSALGLPAGLPAGLALARTLALALLWQRRRPAQGRTGVPRIHFTFQFSSISFWIWHGRAHTDTDDLWLSRENSFVALVVARGSALLLRNQQAPGRCPSFPIEGKNFGLLLTRQRFQSCLTHSFTQLTPAQAPAPSSNRHKLQAQD